MADVDKVARDIRDVATVAASEAALTEHVVLAQQDPNFRRDCAHSPTIWVALRDALNAFTQNSELSSENSEVLLALLRLVQILLAGEPNMQMWSGADPISMNDIGNTLLSTFRILWDASGKQELEKLKLACLRGIANYATIADRSGLSDIWKCVLVENGPFVKIIESWRKEYLHPTLHILFRCKDFLISTLSDGIKVSRNNGLRVFRQALIAAAEFWNDDQSPIFITLYGLVRDLLSAVTIHDLWREIAASTGEGENHQIERQLELRGRLVLMKLADGMINDSILDLKGLRIECFVSTMKDLIDEKVQAALSTASTFNTEEVEGIASLLQLHLEIFKTLFQPDHNPNISSKESISLTGLLIESLGLLVKYIPRRGLTSPTLSDTTTELLPSSITDLFKGTKRDIIEVITLLLTSNKDLQNTIRDLGGIQLILSQCNIDDDNPYIKERAVLCVRELMEGNERNQALVRDMHVMDVVP